MNSDDAGLRSLQVEVKSVRWYHSIELPGGRVTPGIYDLASSVQRALFPSSLAGRRCLDVGTHDGFWAFEMEERGAVEVVAIDLDDPQRYELRHPGASMEILCEQIANRRQAFDIAHRARRSNVQRKPLSVYDLSAEEVGIFDFAFVGTLLHHLRDPVRALVALRRVVTGELIVNGAFSVTKSIMFPRSPVADVLPQDLIAFWSVPNLTALRRQVEAAGWDIVREGRPYIQSYGKGRARGRTTLRPLSSLASRLAVTRGAPHVALMAKPASDPRSPVATTPCG